MTDQVALNAITNAIMWDQHMDKAKAEDLAKAAVRGLEKAGYVVVPKERAPDAKKAPKK